MGGGGGGGGCYCDGEAAGIASLDLSMNFSDFRPIPSPPTTTPSNRCVGSPPPPPSSGRTFRSRHSRGWGGAGPLGGGDSS